ncbi:MAG: cation:proton antiporter [Actinomycetota bacterium]|nr:cation:proton antiporter [Actinomycetota bacterium]
MLATASAVAVVVDLVVPGLGFSEGLVLGAIVAPTDPVAATGVFRRLGAPRFVVDVVEGESLINDATALVLYAVAVEAVLTGPPDRVASAGRLVLSVAGGLLVGVAVGGVVLLVRNRLTDSGLLLLLSLFTPYAAYVAAEQVHVSGVLAVVVAGLLLGSRPVRNASVRLQSAAFWSLLDLLLNAVLFVLLGLQVRRLLDDAPPLGPAELALDAAAVVLTVVGVRLLWQFVVPHPVYLLRAAVGRPQRRSSPQERLLIGWSGMRGAISLAAALALPLEVDGQPFPGRDLLLFLTIVVVLVTLVAQGTTLPLMLRWTGQTGDESDAEHERAARLALAEAALARLDELEAEGAVPPGGTSPLRQLWEQARTRLTADLGPDPIDAPPVDLTALRLDVARVQEETLERLRREHALPAEVVRELRQELDLQRVRLTGPRG